MAPNRKSLSALTLSVDSLDLVSTVQPKYLPLTHPLEASRAQETCRAPPVQQDSFSYWEWSSDDIVEDDVCVLSSDNIVSNLIQAGNALTQEENVTNREHDDYWCEEQEVAYTGPLSAGMDVDYWSWDDSTTEESRPSSRVADLIMATHPTRILQRQQERSCALTETRGDSASHSYWAW